MKCLRIRRFRPERRLNPKLKNRLDEATNIVTQHLTKSLIDLSGLGLASQRDSELRLDQVKRGFNVRSFVIALHESLRIEVIQVKHLLSGSGLRSKTKTAQIHEALCKILCHNHCCLIQSMFELNIKTEFWDQEVL
jgi:hypothetical protein